MLKKQLDITNKLGLHARAAAKFVTLASAFESDIQLTRDSKIVNGKSIMGVMMLAAANGSQVEIIASGSDEAEAIKRLQELVQNKFDEDE